MPDMPLDRLIAKKLINTAQAFGRHPAAEYIQAIANQLSEALKAIEEFDRKLSSEMAKTTMAETALASERDAFRVIRDRVGHVDEMKAVLAELAVTGKGVKGKARAACERFGIEVAAPVVEGGE